MNDISETVYRLHNTREEVLYGAHNGDNISSNFTLIRTLVLETINFKMEGGLALRSIAFNLLHKLFKISK